MRWARTARLAILLLVLLCACGRKSNPLDRIRAAGVLRVAMDPAFPPFEFVDGEGTLVGLDVDLARAIAAQLGVEAQFVAIGYDGLYDALTVGRADVIISALYPDPGRMNAFAFTPSYFNAGEVLVVPGTSPIAGVQDLAGKRVALVLGTDAHVEALQWQKQLAPPLTLVLLDAVENVIAALTANTVDAAVVDNVTAQVTLAKTPGLRVLAPTVTDEPYVIAARSEDGALIDTVGDILVAMQKDGALNALIRQWMR